MSLSDWKDTEYQTISIAGGDKVTDAELIAWLQENATLIGSASVTEYDLTKIRLTAGEHKVKVIAKAPGYKNSEFSNEATYTVTLVYPVKGDIITIENHRYRVLSINGSQAKVFGLFDAATTTFNSSSASNVYAGSTLDTALNTTWYSAQSTTFQNAVVDTSITTSTYSYSDNEPSGWNYEFDYNWKTSDPDYATRTATTSAITRKVYALDLKDYYDYKGTNTTTSNDLMIFFFEGSGGKGSYSNKYCWTRSARSERSDYVWVITGDTGYLNHNIVSYSCTIRPALTIDLSKIVWSKSE